jgi:N-acetylmuramoyl-L-alanine amidase
LGETLFFNNPVEVQLLLDPSYCLRIARAYANAIIEIERTGLPGYHQNEQET